MAQSAIQAVSYDNLIRRDGSMPDAFDEMLGSFDEIITFDQLTLTHKLHVFREASMDTLNMLMQDGIGGKLPDESIPMEDRNAYIVGCSFIGEIFKPPITGQHNDKNLDFGIGSAATVVKTLKEVYRPLLEKIKAKEKLTCADLGKAHLAVYPRDEGFSNAPVAFTKLPAWANVFTVNGDQCLDLFDTVTNLIETALMGLLTSPESLAFYTADALARIPHEVSAEYLTLYNELQKLRRSSNAQAASC